MLNCPRRYPVPGTLSSLPQCSRPSRTLRSPLIRTRSYRVYYFINVINRLYLLKVAQHKAASPSLWSLIVYSGFLWVDSPSLSWRRNRRRFPKIRPRWLGCPVYSFVSWLSLRTACSANETSRTWEEASLKHVLALISGSFLLIRLHLHFLHQKHTFDLQDRTKTFTCVWGNRTNSVNNVCCCCCFQVNGRGGAGDMRDA